MPKNLAMCKLEIELVTASSRLFESQAPPLHCYAVECSAKACQRFLEASKRFHAKAWQPLVSAHCSKAPRLACSANAYQRLLEASKRFHAKAWQPLVSAHCSKAPQLACSANAYQRLLEASKRFHAKTWQPLVSAHCSKTPSAGKRVNPSSSATLLRNHVATQRNAPQKLAEGSTQRRGGMAACTL